MITVTRIGRTNPHWTPRGELRSLVILSVMAICVKPSGGQEPTGAAAARGLNDSVLAVYSVDELPVYRQNPKSDENFDPTMLVLYLKSSVAPESWNLPGRSILVNRPGRSLVVRQTKVNHERIASTLHRIQLFSRPISRELIAESIGKARQTNRRVLLAVASPESPIAKTTLEYLEDPEHSKVSENYLPHCTTVEHAEPLAELLGTQEGESLGGLYVIDGDGSVVGHLEPPAEPKPKKQVAELLGGAAVPLPSAASLMDEGIKLADATSRRVFVVVSGPGCVHCIRLKAVLDVFQSHIAKDYVVVRLDTRMSDLESVVERYGRTDDEIPWFAVVDSDGMAMITSESKTGNIGFPADAADRKHFRRMFETTRSRMGKQVLEWILRAVED